MLTRKDNKNCIQIWLYTNMSFYIVYKSAVYWQTQITWWLWNYKIIKCKQWIYFYRRKNLESKKVLNKNYPWEISNDQKWDEEINHIVYVSRGTSPRDGSLWPLLLGIHTLCGPLLHRVGMTCITNSMTFEAKSWRHCSFCLTLSDHLPERNE